MSKKITPVTTAAKAIPLGARVCVAGSQRVYVVVGEEWYGATRALVLVRLAQSHTPLATRYIATATLCALAPDGLWAQQGGAA